MGIIGLKKEKNTTKEHKTLQKRSRRLKIRHERGSSRADKSWLLAKAIPSPAGESTQHHRMYLRWESKELLRILINFCETPF
jgi:hypothetical protein